MLCKVVYGSCANGFTDITPLIPYDDCVVYLKAHMSDCHFDSDDPHYTGSLDIMADNGRLMSFTL